MLHSSVVSSAAQAALAAILMLILQRGATTAAARCLAALFGLFAAYSAAIGLGYALVASRPAVGAGCFLLCLVLAYASSLAFSGFLSVRFGSSGARPGLLVIAMVPPVAIFGLGVHDLTTGADGLPVYSILTLLALGIQLLNLGLMLRLRSRVAGADRRALRTYLLVLLVPFLPMLLDVISTWVAPVPGYRLVRGLATMAFLYALLVAFLNDGVQVMSLRARALGGTLMLTLGTVVVSAELVARREGTAQAHDASVSLLVLAAGLVVAVPLLVTLLYRRNFIDPLERLVSEVSVAEGRRFAPLHVHTRDEIGLLTEAFNNTMLRLSSARAELEGKLRELALRNEQVEELNDELRWQLESRSKDLASMTTVERPEQDCRPGDLIGGRYRVIDTLGRGGMGTVYRVARLRDDRQFALKLVRQPDAEAAARFAREAEVAVRLTGPHLVSVVDVGITTGRPFLVMELVLNGSLEDQRSRFGDPPWAIGVLAQIASGLATIHARRVVHRDLKPANVLIASVDGVKVAKISDFGIAKERVDTFAAALPNDGTGRKLTATGALMGTVNYMAPELAEPGASATPAVDIFAFGLIGWELCSGALPFSVPPIFVSLGGGILPKPGPLTVDTDPAHVHLLHQCVAEHPGDRPTADQLVERLNALLQR